MDDQDKNLEEQFKSLPKEVQAVLTSTETAETIKAISQRNGLKIDQESTLFDLVADVLLGNLPSKEFVKNFSDKADLSTEKAREVAEEINTEIFGQIRLSMRLAGEKAESASEQQKQSQSVTDLERIGGFTIEKEEMTNSNDTTNEGMYVEKRPEILAGLENPPTSDALVDHLLTIPTIIPPEHTTSSPLTKSDVTATSTPKPASDPYKEPIN